MSIVITKTNHPNFSAGAVARVTPAFTVTTTDARSAIVVGGVGGRTWPAEMWLEFAHRWIAGEPGETVKQSFVGRGYSYDDATRLVWLLAGSEHLLSPIKRAMFLLGGLAQRDARAPGGFCIGGALPATAKTVIGHANKVAAVMGVPAIKYPGAV